MRLKLMQYQAFADALGLPPAPIEFGLSLPPDEDSRARAIVAEATPAARGRDPWLVVAEPHLFSRVGSGGDSRAWRSRPIGSPALFPVLIGGPEDAAIGDAVMRELDGLEVLNLVGRTRLARLDRDFQRMCGRVRPGLRADAYRGGGGMSGGIAMGFDGAGTFGAVGLCRVGASRRDPMPSLLSARLPDRPRMYAANRAGARSPRWCVGALSRGSALQPQVARWRIATRRGESFATSRRGGACRMTRPAAPKPSSAKAGA